MQILLTNAQLATLREAVANRGGANGNIVLTQTGGQTIEATWATHDGELLVARIDGDGNTVISGEVR